MPQLVLQPGGTLEGPHGDYTGPYEKSVALGDIIVATHLYLGVGGAPYTPPNFEVTPDADDVGNGVVLGTGTTTGQGILAARVHCFRAVASGTIYVGGVDQPTGYNRLYLKNHVSTHVFRPSAAVTAMTPSALLAASAPSETVPTATATVSLTRGCLLVAMSRMFQTCYRFREPQISMHGDSFGTASVNLLASTEYLYNGDGYNPKVAVFFGLYEVLSNGSFGIYGFNTSILQVVPTYDESSSQYARRHLMV